jgi:hypothetical protein
LIKIPALRDLQLFRTPRAIVTGIHKGNSLSSRARLLRTVLAESCPTSGALGVIRFGLNIHVVFVGCKVRQSSMECNGGDFDFLGNRRLGSFLSMAQSFITLLGDELVNFGMGLRAISTSWVCFLKSFSDKFIELRIASHTEAELIFHVKTI